MVRSMYSWAAALAVVAGLTVSSCAQKEQTSEESKVAFAQTEATFSQEGKATLNIAVSPAATAQISAIIAVGSEAKEGFTAIPATDLSFTGIVTIPAGTESFPVEISVDLDKVENGQQAVITISAASGATVSTDKATAYISVNKSDDNPIVEPEPVDLSGANVWGLIGDFNGWGGDVELEKTSDSPETWEVKGVELPDGGVKFRGNNEWGEYDLGASDAVVLGEELTLVHKGGNIILEAGTYDIVLYPTEFKAIFTESEEADNFGSLDWTVEYNGLVWLDGYYSYGQLESFTVADTDGSYYYPFIFDTDLVGSIITVLQTYPEEFLAYIQAEVTSALEIDMEEWGDTFEEALYYVLYNEENDGEEIFFEGLSAGNYEFAVFVVDNDGQITGEYKVISIEHPDDALLTYPWVDQPNLNANWSAEFTEWETPGKYFWITGKAQGAKYVYCEWYTEEEIEDYYEGSITTLLNAYGTDAQDLIAGGYDPVDDIGFAEVDANGNFEYVISTYDDEGPVFPVYIIGFDADGKVISDYGFSEVEVEEYAPIEWQEQTSWVVNYDPANPDAVTASVCDADYYVIEIYPEGWSDYYDVEETADDALFFVNYYGLETCIAAGFAFDSVPGIYYFEDAAYGAENGSEIYMFGLDETGYPTGKYHKEILTGLEEIPLPEMSLVENWSVTPVEGTYDGQYVEIVVDAPGILWYVIEENTEDDLEYYYDGDIAVLAQKKQKLIARELNNGYTLDELLYSGSDPQPYCRVYNRGKETTIYIIEFNEEGIATGRYGATTAVMPSEVAGAPAKTSAKLSAKKQAINFVKKANTTSFNGKLDKKAATAKKQHTYQFNENAKLSKKNAPAAQAPAKQHKGKKIAKK